ncbi:MAG: response regulator transcription factor [Spirochaetota bacterium]
MSLLTLLTVDDEAHIHAGLDAIMDWTALGYRHVGSALNGREGLSLANDLRPAVIVTDIRMPGLDGLQMIEAVESVPDYDPTIIVISGYDDFEYARAALRFEVRDYLLKPIDEDELAALLRRIRETRTGAGAASRREDVEEEVATQAVRRILLGDRSREPAKLAESLLPAGASTLRYGLLLPADEDLHRLTVPVSADAVATILKRSHHLGLACSVVSDPSGGVGVLLLAREDGNSTRGAEPHLQGLQRVVAEELARPVLLAAGPPVSEIAELWRSRQAVFAHLRRTRSIDRSHSVVLPDWNSRVEPTSVISSPEVTHVLETVESLDERALQDSIDQLVVQVSSGEVSSDALSDWVTRLRVELTVLVRDLDGDEPDPADATAIRRIARSVEVVPLRVVADVTLTFARTAMEALRALRRLNRHSVVLLMRRRADRRFYDDLTVDGLAGEYGMSAAYLGRLFRRVTGIGFRDYLRARRVSEARRLLRQSDLLVPEIARSVGYSDVDFFTEQFRRETGTTPAAYRGDGD